MLQEPVNLLNMEQFELLYYRLLPVEGVTIHTGNVSVEWFSLPKHSSSNCV